MAKQLNVNLAMTADTSQAKQQLQQLQQQLTNLTKSVNSTSRMSITQDILDASKAAQQLKIQLEQATNVKTGKLDLGMFQQQMKQSGMSLEKYRDQLIKIGPDGAKAFSALASSITKAEIPLKRSNALLSEFATTMKNTVRWQISSSIMHGFMGSLQSAYGYAQRLNESLNNIRIVTGQSADQMANFADRANKAARELSATTTQYTDAALIFYQQGLDDSAVTERTNAVIKMAHATGDAAKEVSSYMTAIWNNFDDGSTSLEHFGDVLTALGASTASSTSEISEGLEKFASVAQTVGLSYEYATSALATVVAETRQSADVVGTAFKTMFARIGDLELGKTLDDGVDLGKYSQALDKVGVSILDATGNMRQMDDILEDLASKWDTLTNAEQTALAETVAGTRQYTQLMALMNNWDDMKTNLNTANNADGTLDKQQEIYAESWEAARDRVTAAAEDIYNALLDDDFFIALTDGFATFLHGIDDVIDGLGGLQGVLLALGAIITTVFQKQVADSLQNVMYNMKMMTQKGRDSVKEEQVNANKALIGDSLNSGTRHGADMSAAYTQQANLQQSYIENAEHLSEVEQKIAASMLDQQQILIANVEQSSRELENAEQEARLNERRVSSAGGKGNTAIKEAADLLKQSATSAGQYQAALNQLGKTIDNVLGPEDIQELQTWTSAIKQSGVDISLAFGDNAEQAFNELCQSLENVTDVSLETLNNQVDQLFSSADGASEVNMFVENLAAELQAAGMSEEESAQRAQQLADSYIRVGEGSQQVAQKQSQLKSFTEQVAEAFQKQGQQNITLAEGLTTYANTIMSVGMAISSIKGLINTWGDDSKSAGDKVLATITTLGMAIPMLTSAFSANSLAAMANAGAQILIKLGFDAEKVAAKQAAVSTGEFGAVLYTVLLPLGLVIAAVAALVGVITLIVKAVEAAEKASPAGQLKEAKEEAERCAEALGKVKDEVQEIRDEFDQYDSVQEKLKECTKGTEEWRDALQEANAATLDLINKYPELAGALEGSAATGYSINQDALNGVESAANKKLIGATAADAAAQANVRDKQFTVDATDFATEMNNSLTNAAELIEVYGETVIDHNQQAMEALAKNADQLAGLGGDGLSKKIGEVLTSAGYEVSEATAQQWAQQIEQGGLTDGLQTLADELATNTAALDISNELIASSTLANNEKVQNSKYADEVINASGDVYKQLYDEAYSEIKADAQGRGAFNTGTNASKEVWEDYAELMDLDPDSITNYKGSGANASFVYKDENGDKQEIKAEEAAAALAAAQATEQLGESAENLVDKFTQLGTSTNDADQALLSFMANKNYEGATNGQFQDLQTKVDTAGGTEAYLDQQFDGDGDGKLSDITAKQYGYESAQAMIKAFDEGMSSATDAWRDISIPDSLDSTISDKLSLGTAKALEESVDAINLGPLGEEGGRAYVDGLEMALGQANVKDSDWDAALSSLTQIDWSQWDAGDKAVQVLKDMGYELDSSNPSWQAYIESMRMANGALQDFTATKQNFSTLMGIDDKSAGSEISAEEYQALSAVFDDIDGKVIQLDDDTYRLTEDLDELSPESLSDLFVEMNELNALQEAIANGDAQNTINDMASHSEDVTALRNDLQSLMGDSDASNLLAQLGYTNEKLQELVDSGTQEQLNELHARIQDFLGADYDTQGFYDQLAASAKTFDDLDEMLNSGAINADAFNKAWEGMRNQLDEDLDADRIEDLTDQIMDAADGTDELSDSLKDNKKVAKQVAVEIDRYNDAVSDVKDNCDDWKKALKEVNKGLEDGGSLADPDLMRELADAYGDLLNIDGESLSNEFLQNADNLDLMAKAANGSEEAYDELMQKVQEDIIAHCDLDTEAFDANKAILDASLEEMNFKDLEIGANLNIGDALTEMSNLVNAANMTAQQATDYLASMGIDAEVKETQVESEDSREFTDVKPEITPHEVQGIDPVTGEPVTYNFPGVSYTAVPSETTNTSTTTATALEVKSATKSSGGGFKISNNKTSGAKSNTARSSRRGGGGGRRAERRDTRRLTRRDIAKEKISNKERDKERERYVEINDKIDDVNENLTTLNNKLSSISAQEERAFGATKQKLLQKQRDEYIATNKELEKQYDNYKQLEKEQKNYLKSDRKKAEKAGWSFDKNGNVKNYNKTFNKLTQDYNDTVDKAAAKYIAAQNSFNKLSGEEQGKDKNKNALDKAEEAYNDALEKAKEKREEAIELLQQVQEDQEALEDTQHKLEENIEEQNENSRKILDADLETINHALELTIEVDDDALKQLELEIKLLGTSAETASQRMSNLVNNNNIQTDKVQGAKDNVRRILINQLGLSEDQAKGFLNGDDSAASQVYEALNREDAPYDSAAIWDALKGDLDIINGSIEALEDNMSNAFTIMNDFLDETMEAFDRSSKAIQHAKTLTQGYKDIMTAVGRRNVDKSGALTQTMDKALISESGSAYDAAVSKKDTAKYEYDKLIADYNARKKTGQMTETEKDEYEDLVNKALDNLQTAEEEAQSSLQEWIQSVSDYYTDQIELIRTKFEETVAGAAQSISWLKEQMSMKDARDNQYVEDYERIYQLSKLTRDVTKKIDESDNIKVKKMLAEYQDKIVKLQKEGTELSQHDLEYLQKQYEITLAKAQLEEAQNAKTQVRMTRDSEGNFSYVYTANEQNVEDAEQNYETKLYEAQKLNNDYINELENLIISAQEEMSAKIEEIMLDETLTYEEQQKKIEEIKDHYLSMMDYYEDELTNTLNSNKDLYNEEWQNYHEATGHQIADISTMKTNWGDLSIAVLTGKTDMSTYFSEVESAIKEMSSSGVNQLSNVKTSMGEVLAKAGLMTSKIVESKDKNGKSTSQMEVDWTSFGDRVTTVVGDADKGTGLVGAASKAAKSSKDMATSYKASFNDITSKFKDFLNDYEKKVTSTSKVNSNLAGSILDVGKKAKDAANSLAELAAKINALKDRTIKIKINYEYNDPKDKTPSNTTKKHSTPPTTTKKTSGSSGGSKPSWDDVKRVYNLINTQKLGNGRPYRTEEAEKYGYDEETYLLAQRYVNLVYPKNLGGKAYSSAAAKKALGYDTGGYTGDWNSSEGKLAFLHQKEIVLNQEDTKNMLAVVNAVRDISKMIDLNVLTSLSSVGTSAARFNNINKDSLEQNVHITAEFPNVTDKNEILDAFDNVINLASQYANKKK